MMANAVVMLEKPKKYNQKLHLNPSGSFSQNQTPLALGTSKFISHLDLFVFETKLFHLTNEFPDPDLYSVILQLE